jgi:gamma-glutamyltranspeptidase / glutathione hydrolase
MTMLIPAETVYARSAMVSSADHVATGAGVAMLRAGGSAADAAIAANAVLAVTWPQHCGPGGDLFALVHVAGEDEPAALNASGRAGSGADAERLRAEGETAMPAHGDVRSATVPGCVDGWLALHERFGRLDLAHVLEPARWLAAEGFAASPTLVAAAETLPLGYAAAPGAAGGDEVAALRRLTRPGAAVRRPGLARALTAIARDGRSGFYEGPFGEGLLAIGDGEFSPADLERPGADWVPALGLRVWGRQGWTSPPNSQGYLTLAGAWIAERLELYEPGDARWAHALIEAAAAARRDRDALLHDGADGRALLAPPRLAEQRAGIDPARASAPAAAGGEGGTIGLAAVDPQGMGVALIQSNFSGWGTGLFVEGIALQNRGTGFSLREGSSAEYGPGRRPPHTLSPVLVTRPDGTLHTALATMGGHSQPQILLQLLARRLKAGEAPADALAAARWGLEPSGVAVEAHAPSDWFEGLPARGHRVRRRPSWSDEFGHAHLIAVEDDHLAGAADPRTGSGSASGW